MRFDPALLDEIRERLPVSEVAARYVQLRKVGPEYQGLSPLNAERSPSFYVNDRKRAWFDFSANENGDVFKLVMLVDGLDFPAAVEQCARDAGVDLPGQSRGGDSRISSKARDERAALWQRKRAEREAAEARRAKSVREVAYGIWRSGRPCDGTIGARYLEARGVPFGATFSSLRFVDSLPCPGGAGQADSSWPALIAGVRSPKDGRFLSVWRIYLNHDGSGKAPVKNPKLGLGSYTAEGGSVWLGTPGPVAHVCEGIETALGVVGLTGQRDPVYAALSTSGLVNWTPPPPTQKVLIWPDGDADRIKVRSDGSERHNESPGLRAARILANRLKGEGRNVSIQPTPKTGCDYLDVYLKARGILNDDIEQ